MLGCVRQAETHTYSSFDSFLGKALVCAEGIGKDDVVRILKDVRARLMHWRSYNYDDHDFLRLLHAELQPNDGLSVSQRKSDLQGAKRIIKARVARVATQNIQAGLPSGRGGRSSSGSSSRGFKAGPITPAGAGKSAGARSSQTSPAIIQAGYELRRNEGEALQRDRLANPMSNPMNATCNLCAGQGRDNKHSHRTCAFMRCKRCKYFGHMSDACRLQQFP